MCRAVDAVDTRLAVLVQFCVCVDCWMVACNWYGSISAMGEALQVAALKPCFFFPHCLPAYLTTRASRQASAHPRSPSLPSIPLHFQYRLTRSRWPSSKIYILERRRNNHQQADLHHHR
jgi:hypothetical protein